MRTEQVDIRTPVERTTGVKLSHPRPLVVPILRAGLGMLDGMVRLLPTAEVGFLGMIRNEETLQASTYATRMPEDLSGRQVYVLDPMLATGGTLVAAIRELIERGADDVTAVVLLAAPEGVEVMERELAGTPVTVVTASVDERLNEQGYIVPGLGDAGDPDVRGGRVVPDAPSPVPAQQPFFEAVASAAKRLAICPVGVRLLRQFLQRVVADQRGRYSLPLRAAASLLRSRP
ncbi:Uracil phosphoribosyltransferase [Streptomyces griseomycini]